MKISPHGPWLAVPLLLAVAGCFNPEPGPELTDTGATTASTVPGTAEGPGETDDPTAECGNGVVEAGEECDEAGDTATCDADCTEAACGDGYTNAAAGEICDDGNDDPADGCNTLCMEGDCGDGVVAPPETCDDANMDQTDECVACQEAACGDGFVQAGVEECDDADADDTDDCTSMCLLAACGDGFVQAGVEACDDGNADETDACLSTCVAASCGDGFVQAGVEDCDDGNADPSDGCDACSFTCGDDCWSDDGCLTDGGRCIRFTCTTGADSATACSNCFGWQPVSYDQWLNGGYCGDVIDRYRIDQGTNTMCGAAPLCCADPGGCAGGDNAWHFFDGVDNRFVGPCLGCMGDTNCLFWDNVDNSDYTRITVCERMTP